MVLDAVACAYERPEAEDAEAARSLWELVGVVPDPHSSTVFALGLPGDGRTPLGRWLLACAEAGEPVVLSLSNLRRWPVRAVAGDGRIYAVENPSLIAEASSGCDWSPARLHLRPAHNRGRHPAPPIGLGRSRHLPARRFRPNRLGHHGLVGREGRQRPMEDDGDRLPRMVVGVCARVRRDAAGDPVGPCPAGRDVQYGKALYEEEVRAELLRSMLEIDWLPPKRW